MATATFSKSLTKYNQDGLAVIAFSQPDVPQIAGVTGTWTRDTTSPVFAAESRLVGGGTSSPRRYASLHVSVAGAYAQVAAMCVKVDDTSAPDAGDECWVRARSSISRRRSVSMIYRRP